MEKETARIEAFSDGVFAIAITLLILEIRVPTAENDLAAQLLKQWPSYVAFVLSFAFIGIMWINHHRLFTHIRRSNNTLMVLNLTLLLGVTAVPYPTAVLAQHLGRSGQRTATKMLAPYSMGTLSYLVLHCTGMDQRDSELVHQRRVRCYTQDLTLHTTLSDGVATVRQTLGWGRRDCASLCNRLITTVDVNRDQCVRARRCIAKQHRTD